MIKESQTFIGEMFTKMSETEKQERGKDRKNIKRLI